jgi:DNA-binding CsgD family transcriptional regulator
MTLEGMSAELVTEATAQEHRRRFAEGAVRDAELRLADADEVTNVFQRLVSTASSEAVNWLRRFQLEMLGASEAESGDRDDRPIPRADHLQSAASPEQDPPTSSQSSSPEAERQRYERFAARTAELAQLLMTLETLATLSASDMSSLVVKSITDLLDDALTLDPRITQGPRPSPAFASERRRAAIPPTGPAFEVARIEMQAADARRRLIEAISDARQALNAMAAEGGRPDPSLLHAITTALRQISDYSHTLAQLTQAELRASGETARRRSPSIREQLTPQEMQVARLAGQGLSNREIAERLFVSRHTVGYHLHKIYAKLGITSRAEVRELDLDDVGPH